MNIRSQLIKICFLFVIMWLCSLPIFSSFAAQPKMEIPEVTNNWAVTATVFKLAGDTEVRNVKLNWMQREDADHYKIYRDKSLIGEVKGNTYDDYDLTIGKTFTYHVEAFKDGEKVATAESQQATTFTQNVEGRVYDNFNGKYITKDLSNKPQGMQIGDLYFSYRIENAEKEVDGKQLKGWVVTESYSKTGYDGSWSIPRELAFYPNVKFEGNAFRYNPKTRKVVLSSHYEDQDGYVAAKIYLAQITPKGKLEVGTMERPLGHDSRDQSLFIDDDNTAYLLSATNTNCDINIYKLDNSWTKPIALVNTICKGMHRETPAIIKKDGLYYLFSSKASGWYPSQTMYTSTADLAGEWTPIREIGNSTTFDAQFNRVSMIGTTYGVWSYHWGAQRKYKTPAGNFARISIAAFNKGYASMNYYRYVEFTEQHGLIPIQNGKNLTLNTSVKSTVTSANGVLSDCIIDGADLNSSAYYRKSSDAPIGTPYTFIIDMQKQAKVSEINFSTRLVNGSEAAFKYTIEGSLNGKKYKMLVDGRQNWQVGFLILNVEDPATYRYLRLRIYDVVNIHKGNSAMWADGIYELAAFGIP